MQKGRRKPIPKKVAALVQFISDQTCCVCRQGGKLYQIHHIDNNHNNNAEDNLAILCEDYHNVTQIHGGFYRKLFPVLVRLYRDEWLNMIRRSKQAYEDLGSLTSNNSWAIVENSSRPLSLSSIWLAPLSLFSIYDSVSDTNGNSINILMNSRTVENQIRKLVGWRR
jgi:hypothetical protein